MHERLMEKLNEWSEGYEIDHAFTGEGNAFEQEIVDLAAALPKQDIDCMLYRGTGLEDGVPSALLSGELSEIPKSKRIVQSWTKDIAIAKSFLENAVETNNSAVLLGIHSSRLRTVVDIAALIPERRHEAEVLVLNAPIAAEPGDVIEAWEYDPAAEASSRLDGERGPRP